MLSAQKHVTLTQPSLVIGPLINEPFWGTVVYIMLVKSYLLVISNEKMGGLCVSVFLNLHLHQYLQSLGICKTSLSSKLTCDVGVKV